jgi:sugar-specific transcriptional regulator TrmB
MSEIETLTSLGLTSYEAKAYVALLSLGVSSAEDVGRESKIPNGRIYSVLNSLVDRRLVNVQNSRPKLFDPIDPKVALKNLLKAQKEHYDNEYENLVKRSSEVESLLNGLVPQKTDNSIFWTVAVGVDEVRRLTIQQFDEAQSEVLIFIGNSELLYERFIDRYKDVMNKVDEVADRNIEIRVIVGFQNMESLPILAKKATEKGVVLNPERLKMVRFAVSTSSPFDIIDGERVLVRVSNQVNSAESLAAIAVWDISLANELRNNFNKLWENGKKL